MAQYGRSNYWDERYTRDPEPFDWYQRWDGIKDTVNPLLNPNCNILILGCGNSRLGEELYDEGHTQLTNIDISGVVVEAMTEKYRDKSSMSFQQMDCRQLDFPPQKFDVVIDKGTLDSILCGDGSTRNIHKTLTEISRVLTNEGVFICISHGEPSYRMTYMHCQEFEWNCEVKTVSKPMMGLVTSLEEQSNVHYIYICRKGKPFVPMNDVANISDLEGMMDSKDKEAEK